MIRALDEGALYFIMFDLTGRYAVTRLGLPMSQTLL
jgi:hypothetical protein